MEAEEAGSGKEDEPEVEAGSEQEDDDAAGPSTSAGNSSQSNNRVMRNMAEKMRRDKLNFFISELSTLVPIISFSPKKLDKTSILRLAATYIRLHNVIFGSVRQGRRSSSPSPVHGQMMEYLPQYLASFNWSENVLEEMDGMLMIVNGAGRIIFISHTVEKLLGHTQIEMMGQSLFHLTCLEDHDELTRNLSPDDNPTSSANCEGAIDESSSDSCSTASSQAPRMPALPSPQESDQRLRRSFYIRLRQRAQSRSDQPQYELVHVMGHLRVPPRGSNNRRSEGPPNSNDIILVAVVKPFREKRITTLSLMEACREEFITRHTLDGRIIYTDHRISIVAGYLAEEVCGVPGFQYMHKEDMRWTMVGLRQMFFRGSSYGQSCYRLQTKNGTFIYLKTCGYLELSENNDSFQSLICINSLVTAAEGESLIRQMKDQYSPVIKNKNDRNMDYISRTITSGHHGRFETTTGETEDPKVLEAAINRMISDVPSPSPFMHSPASNNIDPTDAAKATLAAKAMPPLSIQIKKIGIVPPIIRTPAAVAASLSPPSSHQHSPPPAPPKPSPPTPPAPPPQLAPHTPPTQNRATVLRVAQRQGDQVSVVKVKRLRTDDGAQEVVTLPEPGPRGGSVLVSPGSKRKSEDDWHSPAPAPAPAPTHVSPPPPSIQLQPPPLSPQFPLDDTIEMEQFLAESDFSDLRIPGDGLPPLESNLEDMDVYELPPYTNIGWPDPQVLESPNVLHQTLDARMQLQGDQIREIHQDLNMVPSDHADQHHYNSRLSQLQVEHRRQQQMLRSLQQDLGQQNVEV